MGLPRWVVVVIVAAVVVLAIDVAIVVLAHDGTAPAAAKATAGGDAVAMIDPGERSVVANVEVGRQPTAIAAGYGGAWVLNRGSGTLTHIDAKTHSVVSTMEPDATANDITLGAGGVWFVGHPRRLNGPLQTAELERIDPATDAVDRTFETRHGRVRDRRGRERALVDRLPRRPHPRRRAVGCAQRRDAPDQHRDLRRSRRPPTTTPSTTSRASATGSRASRRATGTLTNSMTLATDESLAAGNVPPSPTDAVFGARLALDQHHATAASSSIDSQSRRDPEQHPRLPERARDRLR